MSKLLRLKKGKLLWKRFGGAARLLFSAAGAACCCIATGTNPIIPPLCDDTATCNSRCDGKARFHRGEGCKCPCPGRTDFPAEYDWTWTASVKTGVKLPDNGTPPDYWEIVGPSSYSVSRCTRSPVVDYVVNHYGPDGSTFIGTGTASIGPNDLPGFSRGDCLIDSVDRPDLQTLYMTGRLYLAGNLPNELTGGIAGYGPFEGVIPGGVSACFGGTMGTPCNPAFVGAVPPSRSPFANDDGVISISPACFDCDGELVDFGFGPPHICGRSYVVGANVDDGPLDGGGNPTTQLHVYTLLKTGATTWIGVDQFGNDGDVTMIAADPFNPTKICCPKDEKCPDVEDCDGFGDGPLGFLCRPCWRLHLTASGSFVAYFGTDYCPNGWTQYDSAGPYTFDLNSFGFLGDCPPGV